MSFITTKFHKILLSGFRGVVLTRKTGQTDWLTDGSKTLYPPQHVAWGIMMKKKSMCLGFVSVKSHFMYENMTTTEPWFICGWMLTGEYVAVLRKCPEDPLVNLCIGLTFIHLAGQKFSSKKHSLFTQVSHALPQRLYFWSLIICYSTMWRRGNDVTLADTVHVLVWVDVNESIVIFWEFCIL